jgi:hypothetical protein
MRQLRSSDWEYIVAGVNLTLALILINAWKKTDYDAYAMAAAWCSATAVIMLIKILRRVIND